MEHHAASLKHCITLAELLLENKPNMKLDQVVDCEQKLSFKDQELSFSLEDFTAEILSKIYLIP
jgi:hypothetical protein